ncbi:SDR family oxidoreductase [uncultured Desulfobacter sp.]|uniref:NAD(P)-dependent oxidoreductase n=1 Tax=uncultured Desulfobacter sp. TaxID=240139 RepID=UPI002AAB6E8E|nr:SDR family oxidoreductase [uncultured Desulfobacter sp.]
MKLIIFGATGATGCQVVTQALGQEHHVTAFARNPQKLKIAHENLQVIQGNVLDYSAVEQAVTGQEVVLCTLGLPDIRNKSQLRANGTKNIIRAMKNTGVRRFLCQSSHGVGDTQTTLPFFMKYIMAPFVLRRVFEDHELQEKLVKETQLDWIIVRPTNLTDGDKTAKYQQGTIDNKTARFKISRADVADFMLKQLVDNLYLHKTPSISY